MMEIGSIPVGSSGPLGGFCSVNLDRYVLGIVTWLYRNASGVSNANSLQFLAFKGFSTVIAAPS